jgi:hypothetical protein
MPKLTSFLIHCETDLGPDHRDLRWYDHARPRIVTKRAFFVEYAWSLLVWNRSRRAAETFAEQRDFWRVFTLKAVATTSGRRLVERIRVDPSNHLGRRFLALAAVGKRVDAMKPAEFRETFFLGERSSSKLGVAHARRLRELRLFGVGPANAAFIVRNLGGEMVKCDRWLVRFLRLAGLSCLDLERAARKLGWGVGRVDAVLWSYCEQNVKEVSRLAEHLRAQSFSGAWTAD